MTYAQSIKSVFIEKYSTFKGRASVSEFWWSFLFSVLIYILGLIIIIFLTNFNSLPFQIFENEKTFQISPGIIISVTFYKYLVFWPIFAASVRRLHDSGVSGWWLLAPILPAFILSIIDKTLENVSINSFVILIGSLISLGLMLLLFFLLITSGGKNKNKYGEPR